MTKKCQEIIMPIFQFENICKIRLFYAENLRNLIKTILGNLFSIALHGAGLIPACSLNGHTIVEEM